MNEDKVIEKILDNTSRLDRIEEKITKLDTIETNVNAIIGTLDEIKGMLNKQEIEQVSNVHALRRHEQRIERLKDVHNLSHSIA